MRIATVNVNGIRAAMRKGMVEWLAASQPDVLLLQETRAPEEIITDLLPGWHVASDVCRIKGRAGVAIATRSEPLAVRGGVPGEESDVDSGRWLEADLALPDGSVLTVVSTYLHSGTAGTPTMDLKYSHLDLVEARLGALAAATALGGEALVAGDFNVVRGPRDIKNFRPNHNKTAGVLDPEMAYLSRWFETQWVDVHRELAGDVDGPYTWWSQRGKAFDNDAGWRIDYQIATPRLARTAFAATVDRAPSYDTRFSDHAPVVIDYDLAAL